MPWLDPSSVSYSAFEPVAQLGEPAALADFVLLATPSALELDHISKFSHSLHRSQASAANTFDPCGDDSNASLQTCVTMADEAFALSATAVWLKIRDGRARYARRFFAASRSLICLDSLRTPEGGRALAPHRPSLEATRRRIGEHCFRCTLEP
ncbi:hypothetical protein [Sphingomonas radiodurans]|uniref:hypothetical protein n=1 Tax=Sphingomonas radiodurans TaxID=2890321 RepID=UPI001E4E6AED|nr:hypothetical protein [Sphingomonas radiodurans]WBH15458.1 hypothetical protein LLW23_11495 [Sphingomonas radiodurans]